MRKLLVVIGTLCMSIYSIPAFAGVTSYDNTFVASDVFASDFHTRLNANFTKSLTGGINAITAANVTDDSLTEADMADEINPRVRTYEGAACEFVYTGLLPVTGASLTQNTSAGTAYPRGYRVNKGSATAHTYTASKWTWVDLDQNGNFQYSEQAIGTATPAVASNSIRLARVSTDGTTVVSVSDLRRTSCTSGPFSAISDATNEGTLSDIFKNNTTTGYVRGLVVSRDTSTTIKVLPGSAYINGKYRTLASNLTVPTTAASSINGVSGLDTGSLTAGTNYYVYAAADRDGVASLDVVLSTSATAPSGVTNYRRIGEISTDASTVFSASSDPVTVSGFGKIVQIKKFTTGAVATGNTTMPWDDSIPQITEGNEYMRLPFTPVNANDKLKICTVFVYAGAVGQTTGIALFQDNISNALAAINQTNAYANRQETTGFCYHMVAGTTSETNFKIRAGDEGGSTITFNGVSGTRKLGGVSASSMEITEYEG